LTAKGLFGLGKQARKAPQGEGKGKENTIFFGVLGFFS
jgi:hypothetical protein